VPTHTSALQYVDDITNSSHDERGPTDPATGRDRLRAIAQENGFVAGDSSAAADIDEFIRGDRIVHIKYGPNGRILDILVNGECLFNRERSVAAHRRRAANSCR
jgi:hypothetical protein